MRKKEIRGCRIKKEINGKLKGQKMKRESKGIKKRRIETRSKGQWKRCKWREI